MSLKPTTLSFPSVRSGAERFFSDIDLSINILERGFFSASYLSGPDGGLLKHVTTGSAEEQRFGVWLDQKLAFGHADGPTDNKPESLFQKTASVSQLSIVVPSTLWGGATGTVPRQWRPFTAFVSRTYELPACGPVHAGLDAMLAVLQQRNPQRAFILKDANKEDYVLVEPPAGGPVPVSIQQLFPRTPDGNRVSHESFYWVAVYLGRSPVPLRLAPKEPWLYRNFLARWSWRPSFTMGFYPGICWGRSVGCFSIATSMMGRCCNISARSQPPRPNCFVSSRTAR